MLSGTRGPEGALHEIPHIHSPPPSDLRQRVLLRRLLWLLALGLLGYLVGSVVLFEPAPWSHYVVLLLMGASWVWGLAQIQRASPERVGQIAVVVAVGAVAATLWLVTQTANAPLAVSAMAVAVVLNGLLFEGQRAGVLSAALCGGALITSRMAAEVGWIEPISAPPLTAAVGSAIHLGAVGVMLMWFGNTLHQSEAARERSARFYAALFTDSPEPAFLCDAAGKMVAANPATVALLGFPLDALMGHSFSDLGLIPATTSPALQSRREAALVGPVPPRELTLTRPDGSTVLIESRAGPVVLPDGRTFIQVLLRDLSERQRAEGLEADLREEREEARRTEALVRMAGGMAHDINNLLTIILGAAALAAEDEGLSEEGQEDIREIERAGQRAAAMTRQLLAFSRRQILSPEVIDLHHLLHATERRLTALAAPVPLTFTYAHGDGPAWVSVDVMQLERALHNLLTNARDASPMGEPITLRLFRDAAGGVGISVSDAGPGIPSAVQERMFEPFYTTKSTGDGSGLGLSTALGIVSQSGGELRCETAPGEGTTFTVLLPAARPVLAAEARDSGEDQPIRRGRGERVLVVDDEATLRELVARELRAAGYTPLLADGPEGAVAVHDARPAGDIALLVTDIDMPGGSGVALSRRLGHLPALFISGHVGELERGTIPAARFLAKPFSREALLRAVQRCMGR